MSAVEFIANFIMKVTAKLIGIFLLGIVLLAAVHGYLTVQSEHAQLKREMEENAEDLGHEVRETLVIAWRDEGHRGAVRLVRQLADRHQHMTIRWVALDQSATPPAEMPVEDLRKASAGAMVAVTTRDETGREHHRMYYPVDVEDRRPGVVEFTESLDEVSQYTRQTVYRTAATIAAMLLCGLFVSLLGVRIVGRRLDQLTDKTKRIAQGNFTGPVDVGGNDEISELAVALNQMSHQLQQQQEEIRSETAARAATVEQLRHADRLKTVGRLASGMAHELGTPLNVVSGRAQLIASGRLDDQQIRDSAVVIKSEADRMATIIRQLLDFARRRTPQRTQVDLRDVVAGATELLRTLSRQRNVELVVSDSEAMPANVDAAQIQQVVTNLIVNAIHASDDGSQVRVSLAAREAVPPADENASAGLYCCIVVEDAGAGISEEDMPYLFEPFFTTKPVGEGTGLGLSVSYGIVEDHDGWIDVESRPGEGSRFTVYLPKQRT